MEHSSVLMITSNPSVDPESGGLAPPAGLLEPIRGFGKVWRENQAVQDALGWATGIEQGNVATAQDFSNGRMLYIPVRGEILILIYSGGVSSAGTWRAVPGQF